MKIDLNKLARSLKTQKYMLHNKKLMKLKHQNKYLQKKGAFSKLI